MQTWFQQKRRKLFENEFHLGSRYENQLAIFKWNTLKDFWLTIWRCYDFQGELLFTSKRLHMRTRSDHTIHYAFYGLQGELLAELKNGKTAPDTSYELKIVSKPELTHLFIAATMCIDFKSDFLLMKDF